MPIIPYTRKWSFNFQSKKEQGLEWLSFKPNGDFPHANVEPRWSFELIIFLQATSISLLIHLQEGVVTVYKEVLGSFLIAKRNYGYFTRYNPHKARGTLIFIFIHHRKYIKLENGSKRR